MFKNLKRKYLLILFHILLIFSLASCQKITKDLNSPPSSTEKANFSKKEQKAFEDYLEKEFKETVSSNTLTLHFTLKNPKNFGIKRPKASFGNISLEDLKSDKTNLQKAQTKLHKIEYSSLTEEQTFLYNILDYYFDTYISMSDYYLYGNPFSANTGLSTQLPITMAKYEFYVEEDIKDYLSLINQIPTLFHDYIEIEKEQAKEGLFMADFAVDNTISQIDTFLNTTTKNCFITSFDEKIDKIDFLSDDQRTTYKKNNAVLIREKIIPAYKNLREELIALKGSGKNEGGVCHLKNGKKYYEHLVKSQTGSNKTPSEWIKKLENRISSLILELQTISKQTPSAFKAFYSLTFDNSDYTVILEQLKEDMKDDFPEISDVDYTITEIPPSLQNSTTAAFYMIPPLDDSTQNSICINKASISSNSPLLPTLAHEGYPGHLYQTNYFREHNSYPIRQLISFIGYSEGWGFYVENLSYQYLDFKNYNNIKEEICRIYQINNELNYLVASLADLYVNYEGYTKEKLQKYLHSYHLSTGNSDKIFETVIQDPTIYLKYYAGYIEIVNLKTKCEKELGKNFHLKEFHKVILDAGPCPFSLLEQKIDDYLQKKEN
ncbi:MAG: DUF885 domain-containing protein [Lachnospiraceae bacterium]